MKNAFLTLPLAVIALSSVGAVSAFGSAAERSKPTKDADRESRAAAAPRRPLDPGMTADEVRSVVGKPAEVRTLKSPEGTAEVWTYRRELGTEVVHTPTTVEQVPAFVGIGVDGPSRIQTRTQEIYSLQHITSYQVTELLMFDGKLANAKQWREKRRSFE